MTRVNDSHNTPGNTASKDSIPETPRLPRKQGERRRNGVRSVEAPKYKRDYHQHYNSSRLRQHRCSSILVHDLPTETHLNPPRDGTPCQELSAGPTHLNPPRDKTPCQELSAGPGLPRGPSRKRHLTPNPDGSPLTRTTRPLTMSSESDYSRCDVGEVSSHHRVDRKSPFERSRSLEPQVRQVKKKPLARSKSRSPTHEAPRRSLPSASYNTRSSDATSLLGSLDDQPLKTRTSRHRMNSSTSIRQPAVQSDLGQEDQEKEDNSKILGSIGTSDSVPSGQRSSTASRHRVVKPPTPKSIVLHLQSIQDVPASNVSRDDQIIPS